LCTAILEKAAFLKKDSYDATATYRAFLPRQGYEESQEK
jgi:hypothetical protein